MKLPLRVVVPLLAGSLVTGGAEALRSTSVSEMQRRESLTGESARIEASTSSDWAFDWAFQRPGANENSWRFTMAAQEYRNTGICERWMDPRTGAVRVNELPSQMLYELSHQPTIDAPEYLADRWERAIENHDYQLLVELIWNTLNSPLVIVSAVVGLSVLALYILGFAWKTCCRVCRRSCCCFEEKRRSFSAGKVLLLTSIGGLLLAGSLVLLSIGEAFSIRALSAVGSAGCVLQQTVLALRNGTGFLEAAEGHLPGTDQGSSDPESDDSHDFDAPDMPPQFEDEDLPMLPFIGLTELNLNVNRLQDLVSPHSETNVKNVFDRHLDASVKKVQHAVERIGNTSYLLKGNVITATKLAEKFYHSFFLGQAQADVLNLLEKVHQSSKSELSNYVQLAQKIADGIQIPNFDASQLFPMSEIDASVADAESIAASVTENATPIVKWLSFAVTFEGLLLVSGLVSSAVALIIFLMSKARQSSTVMAISWHLVAIFSSMSLLTTGAFFLSVKVGHHVCAWTAEKTLLKTTMGSGGAGSDFISGFGEFVLGSDIRELEQCMLRPNVDLLDLLDKRTAYQDALMQIDQTKMETLMNIPPYTGSPDLSNDVSLLKSGAETYGDITMFNAQDYMQKNQLKDPNFTFEEILKSGLQWEDRKVPLNSSTLIVVYGLRSVEQVLSPARLARGNQSFGEGVFVISPTNPPSKDDSKFQKWLDDCKNDYQRRVTKPHGDADKYRSMLQEGVMIAQQKMKLLDASTTCLSVRGTRSCTGEELLGEGMNAVKASAQTFTEAGDYVDGLLGKEVESARNAAESLFDRVRELCVDSATGLNCGFVRRTLTEAAFLACPKGIGGVNSAALFRFVGALLAVLLFVYLMILWRFMKDNEVLRDEQTPESPRPLSTRGASQASEVSEAGSKKDASRQDGRNDSKEDASDAASEGPSEEQGFDSEQPLVSAHLQERDEAVKERHSMWATESEA